MCGSGLLLLRIPARTNIPWASPKRTERKDRLKSTNIDDNALAAPGRKFVDPAIAATPPKRLRSDGTAGGARACVSGTSSVIISILIGRSSS